VASAVTSTYFTPNCPTTIFFTPSSPLPI
jgi:hypothetical protein